MSANFEKWVADIKEEDKYLRLGSTKTGIIHDRPLFEKMVRSRRRCMENE